MDFRDVLLAKQLAKNDNSGEDVDLSDYYTKSQTDQRISSKVAEIVADAPDDFDTLKEISDWIAGHEDSAAAMNTAIVTNTAEIANTVEQTALNLSTLGYQRKNLLKNTAKSQTKNGVTFTVNDDNSITANGTATANALLTLQDINLTVGRKYTLSGCPSGGGENTFKLYGLNTTTWGSEGNDFGSGATFTNRVSNAQYRISISAGYTAENLTFYPMLRYAEITDGTYEPYRPSVAEYIASLEERIIALESVNLITNSPNSSLNTAEINTTEEEENEY